MSEFLQHLKNRRTIYAIGKNLSHSNDQIEQLIVEAVKHSPSAFNSQSSRVVTLFGAAHYDFWDIVRDTLKAMIPADAFANTNAKINSFAAGVGTVLFYEDQAVVYDLQQKFAAYAENFPIWSEHSSAIAQFAVWTALSEQNIGASLQHYNPIIDEDVAEKFDIPDTWKLRAQLVFGSIEAPAGEKAFMDDAERFKRFG